MGRCDLELLLNACQASYRLTKEGTIDDKTAFAKTSTKGKASFLNSEQNIQAKGYKLAESVRCSSEKSNLTAVCLTPIEGDEPIVIAIKGTTSSADMASNLSIVKTRGRALENMRNDAYQFYLKMREKYPTRQFVIAGHSLGGNLAQDVALRAYIDKGQRNMVRTINSAPVKTDDGEEVSKKYPEVLDDFVHYRLSRDIVSSATVRKMFGSAYGDVYCFHSKKYHKSRYDAHQLYAVNHAMQNDIGSEMGLIQIGTSSNSSLSHEDARMAEMFYGVQHSYESRVNGRWYRRFTMGPSNIKTMDKALNEIKDLIIRGSVNHEEVIHRFDDLLSKLLGRESRGFVKNLREQVVKRFFPGEEEKHAPKEKKGHDVFHYFKALYHNIIRGDEAEKTTKQDKGPDDTPPPSHMNLN